MNFLYILKLVKHLNTVSDKDITETTTTSKIYE